MSYSNVAALVARPGARQFVKFCVVGLSSTIIDFGLLNVLHYHFGMRVLAAATISFFVAVCNGFYWNRRWTFRAQEANPREQYPKFLATNMVGWLLNVSIMTGVIVLATQIGWLHTQRTALEVVRQIAFKEAGPPINPLALNGAKAVATVVVTAWNFTASKFWTFKKT